MHFIIRLKWVVLLSSTFVATCVYGLLFSFGSLITYMLDKFQESRSKTATVQATLVGVALSTGVMSGLLIKRLGLLKTTLIGATLSPLGLITAFFASRIEHLYICIGIITGLGTSILFVSCTVATGISFNGSQKLLAIAIQSAGINVAGMILPHFLKFIVRLYGLNGAFLLLGGIHLNCFIVTFVFGVLERKHEKILKKYLESKHEIEPSTTNDGNPKVQECNDSSLKSSCNSNLSFLSFPYLLNLLAIGLIMSSLNGFKSLLLDILEWKSLSRTDALLTFPIGNGAGLFARLLSGLMKQCKGVNSLVMPTLFSFCGFFGQILIHISSNFSVILVGCVFIEIAVSGVITSGLIAAVQIINDNKHLAVGIGLINTTSGLLAAALGPIYGMMRDTSGSYGLVIKLTAAFQFVGASLFIATAVSRKVRKARQPD